jgi:hypothetical protein
LLAFRAARAPAAFGTLRARDHARARLDLFNRSREIGGCLNRDMIANCGDVRSLCCFEQPPAQSTAVNLTVFCFHPEESALLFNDQSLQNASIVFLCLSHFTQKAI